jgi:hypothetical protein
MGTEDPSTPENDLSFQENLVEAGELKTRLKEVPVRKDRFSTGFPPRNIPRDIAVYRASSLRDREFSVRSRSYALGSF